MNIVRMLILASVLTCADNAAFALDPILSYSRIHGTVVEAATGKPVSGAHVLAWWEWQFGSHSVRHGCANADATISDADGRFAFNPSPESTWGNVPLLSKHPLIGYPRFIVYGRGLSFGRPGYGEGEVKWQSDGDEIQKKRGWVLLLIKSAQVTTQVEARGTPPLGDAHERLRELLLLSEPLGTCERAMDRSRVVRFFESIAEEARAVAKTDYELRLAAAIALRAKSPLGEASRPLWGRDALRLVSAGSGPPDIDTRFDNDQTQLMYRALAGDFAQVSSLLQAGANPNRTTFTGEGINYGYSALTQLIHAIGYADMNRSQDADRHVKMIAHLLADKRTDPNWRNEPLHYTPLMSAAARVQDDVVKLLLAEGADPNLKVSDKSALGLAEDRVGGRSTSSVAGGSPGSRTVQLLRQAPALGPMERYLALSRAINGREPGTVSHLISVHAYPYRGLASGIQPSLHHATHIAILNADSAPAVEVVKILAKFPGKDVPFGGKTAQQLAIESGRKDLIELLR